MKIGDLVKSNLTDEIGIVVDESRKVTYNSGTIEEAKKPHSFRVEWSTGRTEWTSPAFSEVI
tara:strand:- start:530 stop:715 length:186 start_codon:yes stop_codon:yes gene_type:complete